MRILLSNNFYYPNMLGGAEMSALTLAEMLTERGHEVRVLCLSGTEKTDRLSHNGVEVIAMGRKLVGTGPTSEARSGMGRLAWHLSAGQDFGWQKALREVIAEKPTDIVNSFNLAGTTTQLWSAVKALGLPLVRTSPDHGTGYDAAANDTARPDSLIAAIRQARMIADNRKKIS